MDKKQNRSVQAPTKGVGTDSKKTQEITNGKFWRRGGRKREPAGTSFTSKNEPNRKPTPQRNKFLDKRPKSRGGYCAGTTSGKENTRIAEQDAELGSVFVPGSKKQSLNHLLNFHYTPRGDHWNSASALNKSGSNSHRWLSTQKHKYNKEQFLQANCQFVVNYEGDYKLYMNNPDSLVDWDLVEQIHVQVSEFPSCPICLYSPVAAKMTRCGHVYCWSCILHYLALSDKSSRKCPICYESIHKNDLKSVIAIPHAAFNVGEYITLRLMKRAQGSLTAVPVDEAKITRNSLLNMSETKVNTVYSKLLLANSSEVMSIIDRELKELTDQLKNDDNCPEKCFIEQALKQLEDREKMVFNKICNSYKNKEPQNDNQLTAVKNLAAGHEDISASQSYEKDFDSCTELTVSVNDSNFESVNEWLEGEDFNATDNLKEVTEELATSDNNIDDNIKYYYFYQADDGQHIYLHAVNIRMLEHSYGSLKHCPTTLNGRIVEKEGGSMTEDLRRRLRYLQHLPVTCQFEVAEIQLRPPIVTKETLDYFKEQLETRKKRRQRRARDEKRREKRIEVEENRRLGCLPEVNVHIDSLNQFPQFGTEESTLAASPPSSTSEIVSITPITERSPSPSHAGSVPFEEQYAGPSFAKMLATGKSKPTSWPGLSKPSQCEPIPPQHSLPRLINVTGSQSPSTFRNNRNHNSGSDPEPEPDGYVPTPAFSQSFSDAIALAFEKASISGNDINGETSGNNKKKKKNKKKVLFATSMVYSGK